MKYTKTKPNQLVAEKKPCKSCGTPTLFRSSVLPKMRICDTCEPKIREEKAFHDARERNQRLLQGYKARNRRGSNQYRVKSKRRDFLFLLFIILLFTVGLILAINAFLTSKDDKFFARKAEAMEIISPLPAVMAVAVSATPTPSVKAERAEGEVATELEQVVAYIARTFEPEGKDVVVRAINCFYSESGLRPNAVGQNSDAPRSRDHGIAQLNDYWHKLTEAQKTDIYANIDKAYEIYKGRGGNFSAWYGRLCN